jgi:hypothetical protein
MTERDITGQIKRSGLNRLPALLGIDESSLEEVAERVRQFDRERSDETRQRKALEKLAILVGKSTLVETVQERSNREDLRKREVEALEMTAVAQAYPYEQLRNTRRFEILLSRLGIKPTPTREVEGETREH